MVDARRLNWRFVVPDEPGGLLLLPIGEEGDVHRVPSFQDGAGTLPREHAGAFPAIAAADLAGWTRHGGRSNSAGLLADLCAEVSPGGWLCVGFANSLYPRLSQRQGSMRLHAARRVLHRSGMAEPEVYACLPSHRRPGLLVPLRRPAELDFVLHRLFLTYAPTDARWPRLRRHLLALMQRCAVAAPHRVRVALAPGYCLVSRRPA
jgi:hypothetical protein